MFRHLKNRVHRILEQREDRRLLSALSEPHRRLISDIRASRLTYLSTKKLASVAETCRSLEHSGVQGLFLEAGCALGGSSILIATIKGTSRPFNVYDVFGMIPPPTQEDSRDVHNRYRTIVEGKSEGIGGDKYYGYEENLIDIVRANLKRFAIDCEKQNVSLIQGLVQDTMRIAEPVAFAHIDVDWYEPVMTCLERIFPRLPTGGSIILDDYHDWGGCRRATDDYLLTVAGQFTLDDAAGSMKITKT